jgi:prevent-host-death family protein
MQLQTIGTYETKTHLADLLRRVQDGQGFTITQRGTPVADLLPAGCSARRTGVAAAMRMKALMGEGVPASKSVALKASDFKALIESGRDWPEVGRPVRFVLDNSVVMRWLLKDGSQERLAYAGHVLDLLGAPNGEALVTGIWALEVANVVVKAQAKGLVSEARATAFIGLLQEMAIEIDTHTAARALGDTLQLARRFTLSAYYAAYLELALREGLPLATLDADLRKAVLTTGGIQGICCDI